MDSRLLHRQKESTALAAQEDCKRRMSATGSNPQADTRMHGGALLSKELMNKFTFYQPRKGRGAVKVRI